MDILSPFSFEGSLLSMAEPRVRWGGVSEEVSAQRATARAEEIMRGLNGRREELGYKCTLHSGLQIGDTNGDYLQRGLAIMTKREREEEQKAARKQAKREEILKLRKEAEETAAQKAAEDEIDARRRAADPVYAAKRMAEEEAAVLQRLEQEKREIETQFANAEAGGRQGEQDRAKQQDAAEASLKMLEREKKKRDQASRAEADKKALEGSSISAYEKAKAALALKEAEKLKVQDVGTRGALKMSFNKKSII